MRKAILFGLGLIAT